MEDWMKMMDNGKQVDVIYTDYSKAFDTVSHSKLLLKLDRLGIKGQILEWIKDFVTDRTQRVRVEEFLSQSEKVKSGVPQGSVLGPVLFLIFINDLPQNVQEALLMLFADDAKIAKEISNTEDREILQKSVNQLVEWSKKWSLKLNPSKCKVINIGRGDVCNNEYYINLEGESTKLSKVESEKDLGVHIDNKLSFDTHISKSVKSANRVTGLINRSFKRMGSTTFTNLYKSLIRPHMEYGSVVWNPHTVKQQKLVEGVQRRATKLTPKMQDLNYEQRLVKLGLPSLQYRRIRADMLQVYKIMHGFDKIAVNKFFEMNDNRRTRGHKFKIKKQRCKTNIRKYSFSERVVDGWNALPEHVVDAPNINTFKSRLNVHWKTHPVKFSPTFYK
jgi:hypothetical protein